MVAMIRVFLAIVGVCACVWPLSAQWTNRYQRIGQGHHVYIEGYDFPTYSVGPTYPAVSPDGRTLAFSARGWLWTMSTGGGAAERLTTAAGMDSRPAWHPDGRRLAFVRDDTRNTDIVEIDIATGTERVLAATPAAELDPAYSPDGRALYFASAETGDLEIYRLDLASQQKMRLTDARGLDLRPQPLVNGAVVIVSKRGSGDEVAVIGADGSRRVLAVASIASLARPAVSADGRRVAVPLPVLSSTAWALQLFDVGGGPTTEIVSGGGHPIMPAWSPDGQHVYFARADAAGVFGLWRVGSGGGIAQAVQPTSWNWKTPTVKLTLKTTISGSDRPVPARVTIVAGNGHPAFATGHQSWLDGQSGLVYAHSPGSLEFEFPAGEHRVEAARGFEHLTARSTIDWPANGQGVLSIPLSPLTGVSLDEWYSGDHHFHLNYGGQTLLAPEALLPMLHAEELDVATPLSANLHTRRIDEGYFNWTRSELPIIRFGQEVRSHFLGHTGHIGIKTLYWPWYWGPGYPIYGLDDRSNHEALRKTRGEGGVNSYVHPVSNGAPFAGKSPAGVPLELVSDAVLGDVDTIELACLWSDELGTSDVWHRLLNVGVPLAPSAGTDAMVDFFRTMAIGTTRVYVHVPQPFTLERYLANLKAGRSFVTTGPLLQFSVNGAAPGDAVKVSRGTVDWALTVASAVPVERVEVLVNGEVAWSGDGLAKPGTLKLEGAVKAPAGGWIAARVRGGTTVWPAMDSFPFAHTAPIWFGAIGSTDREAARRAAVDLLAALDVAEARVRDAYKEVSAPILLGRIAAAREKLRAYR
jgi:TolB protein